MRIYRVYCTFSSAQSEIFLNKDTSHHLVNVLRCQIGDICHVFDGNGNEVKAKISVLNKAQVTLHVLEIVKNETESFLKIHLFQALCKGDKMDVIIQKAVELGVTEITPLLTERCDVKLSDERLEKKMTHWRNIMINATEQSGRAVLPRLNPPLSFDESIQSQAQNLRLLFTPHTNNRISEIGAGLVPAKQTIAIFIGPEGGFSESEENRALNQGVHTVALGKRILRTETASLGFCQISVLLPLLHQQCRLAKMRHFTF